MQLIRNYRDIKQTLGTINIPELLFTANTMELSWHNNSPNISCIPTGTYQCKWTRSNRMSARAGHDVFTYEVLNVPNRAGIRIHPANCFHDLLGCISMGDKLMDIDNDGEQDVCNSVAKVAEFAAKMKYADFELEIIEQFA